MARRRPQIPDDATDVDKVRRTSRIGAYDEVVLGREEVAGGRGDVRGDKTGPRHRVGSKANPRANATDVDPTLSRTPSYDEALFGRTRHRGEAAFQTEVPSKTTNIQRPRTLSAGYNRRNQTLTRRLPRRHTVELLRGELPDVDGLQGQPLARPLHPHAPGPQGLRAPVRGA